MARRLTAKSRLKKGDMLINNKTGTVILLIKKKIIREYNYDKDKEGAEKKVVFWDIYVNKVGKAKGIHPGYHEMKERNIRLKVEVGTLSLVKIRKKDGKKEAP